ncbi:50S ribosomal protein L2 [Candidatus Pacearchaeota archaeon]|nr:50S ribosomal protein L2 [Candidatus Pacearchaeota archaeon]
MGKRIISQRRGRGTNTYKVSKKAFRFKLKYPKMLSGEGKVTKLFNSAAHSAPLAKVSSNAGSFYMPAFKNMVEGQRISFDKKVENGNILRLRDIPVKTQIYNIESRPGDGGIFIKSAGNSAVVSKFMGEAVFVLMPSKKEKKLHLNCRAVVGVVAGAGRLDKPILKAGKQHYIKKSKSKLWPRTSAVKMNAIDHPFGSGRGKNPKSKVAKRNAPPGRKVGLLRPRRTGKKK